MFSLSASKIFFFITSFKQLNYKVSWCVYSHGFVCVLCFKFILRIMALQSLFLQILFFLSLSFLRDFGPHKVVHSSHVLFIFFNHFFSLWFSFLDTIYDIPLCSLTFSFAMCNLMLIPSNAFFSQTLKFSTVEDYFGGDYNINVHNQMNKVQINNKLNYILS